MKKLLPLLCITSLFLSGCFQEKTTPVREYYLNGNPKISGSYLEKTGKKHGEWEYYRKNRELSEIGSWKDGKQEGEWKYYYWKGKLKEIGSFKDGK